MQVGSLIFLAIVATWAVYLLQHWIRRREDAAATRSADRYTEAMRVLEKRVPTPAVETPGSPFVARRATQTPPSRIAEVATMSSSPTPTPMSAPTPTSAPTSAGRTTAARSTARTAPTGATGPARPVERSRPADRPTASRWRRQLRGVVLLLALLWVPTSVVLAVLHVLLWISVPLAVLTVVAVLVWLRFEARADRARARRVAASRTAAARVGSARNAAANAGPARAGARRGPGRSAAADGPNTSGNRRRAGDTAGSRPSSDDTEVIHLGTEGATGTDDTARRSSRQASPASPTPAPADEPARADGTVRREAGSAAYDFEAELARDAGAAPALQPAPEGTWSPVPVPPPTYTMKAKAEPRMTSSGVPADVFATPEFAEEAEELDERALFARRAAGS